MDQPDTTTTPSPESQHGAAIKGPDHLNDDTVDSLLGIYLNDAELPEQLGRYRIVREIGRGGFGRVLLAEDELLKRRVAVKLLRRASSGSLSVGPFTVTAFLTEARMVAKMEHPGIVPIYDVTETDEGEFCIVSRYVEGQTLSEQLINRRFTLTETVRIIIALCDALHHAHGIGVAHRDVKPANIILTGDDHPMLLDFGLARCWSELTGDGHHASGTPGYMSPEQARGEDHLVTGRSDIFSLGAVLHEMLTGKPAFTARSPFEHLEIIAAGGPSSPRQVNASVPKELDRICMRAMASQIRSRYPMMTDMADDLRTWLNSVVITEAGVSVTAGQNGSSHSNPVTGSVTTDQRPANQRVVPRGLRSFDDGDADFFLALVPGPRDRFGLPESLRFWKQRIESRDENTTFRVGVMYGPSGCGKSSLARAGLLPRCADHVLVLYHESRDSGNVSRLSRALHSRFPLPDLATVPPAEVIQKLRTGDGLQEGSKLLIVIDQFEQWLLAAESSDRAEGDELLKALRQCDGVRVQVLLLVRDDFWRGVSRLLADADVELDNSNSALVDLFEPRHAERVLESFGRAYRCLPEDPATPLPGEAREFIKESVRSLEEGHRISPVRLSLFADMFRSREWTRESLKRVGGVSGVAVTFLEESFRGPSASGPNRTHEKAARQVLQLLVPEAGDVRGPVIRQSAMLEVSGYSGQPKLFHELLRVLSSDLRLLTPVETNETSSGQMFWQLTHDHMVPALREWLLARKAATLRGRSEIALGERAWEWHLRPDPARLPGVWEWLRLRILTKRWRWTPIESQWMDAGLKSVRWWGLMTVVAAIVIGMVYGEASGSGRGRDLANRVLAAPPDAVRGMLAQGAPWMKWAKADLSAAAQSPISSRAGLNARLALVPTDPSHIDPLLSAMLEADARAFSAIYDILKDIPNVHTQLFHEVLEDDQATNGRKLRAFVALANFQRYDPALAKADTEAARWLMTSVKDIAAWSAQLRVIARQFSPKLEVLLATAATEEEKRDVCLALAGLHAEEPTVLVRLLNTFPPSSVPLIVSALQSHPNTHELLGNIQPPPRSAAENKNKKSLLLSTAQEATSIGYSNTLLASACLGLDEKLWPALNRNGDRTLRTFLILNAASAGLPPQLLVDRLTTETDPGRSQALLLMLSSYPPSALSAALQERVFMWLRQNYVTEPDGGVHSSIATLMKHWSLKAELAEIQKTLPATPEPQPGMGWWVTPSGLDMRIIRMADGRRVAVSACEVTVQEYRRFRKEKQFSDQPAPDVDAPVTALSWVDAAGYALWLSAHEKMDPEDFCYTQSNGSVSPHEDAIKRMGYRLPTKNEWLTASNSSTRTRWDFGSSFAAATKFGWVAANAGDHPRVVGELLPNEQGLWDTFGNACEWSHEWVNTGDSPFSTLSGRDYASIRSELEEDELPAVAVSYARIQAGMRLARSLKETESR